MILPNVITYPLLVFAVAVRLAFPLIYSSPYFSDTAAYPLTLMNGSPPWMISLAGALLGAAAGGGSLSGSLERFGNGCVVSMQWDWATSK